ncbi:hypothetical protein [Dankookia sp. P2]|uniref:hypothetical protein n=1 Tax=Dankookia sp. P2 TaxID=3423955 RepID=UPI003D6659FF
MDQAERDLLARFSRRQLFARGVPLKPRRSTRYELLPGVWAASFSMCFIDNTIMVDDDLYGAVEVSCTEPAAAASADPPTAAQLQVPPPDQRDVADDVANGVDAPAARRPGSGSFDDMIDKAIERHWDALSSAVTRRGKNPPSWTDLANVLLQRLERENRSGIAIKLLNHEVTRKRLAKQYPKHLVEMAGKS